MTLLPKHSGLMNTFWQIRQKRPHQARILRDGSRTTLGSREYLIKFWSCQVISNLSHSVERGFSWALCRAFDASASKRDKLNFRPSHSHWFRQWFFHFDFFISTFMFLKTKFSVWCDRHDNFFSWSLEKKRPTLKRMTLARLLSPLNQY